MLIPYFYNKGETINCKGPWWFIRVIDTSNDGECSKDKRTANVFGVYDKMHVHGYKKKTGKQFVNFLKRVEKKI